MDTIFLVHYQDAPFGCIVGCASTLDKAVELVDAHVVELKSQIDDIVTADELQAVERDEYSIDGVDEWSIRVTLHNTRWKETDVNTIIISQIPIDQYFGGISICG